MDNAHYISRPDAAQLLRISLRTLDRHIRRHKLKTKREGKNLFLLKEELFRLKKNDPLVQEVLQKSVAGAEPAPKAEARSEQITTWEDALVVRKLFDEYRKMLERKEEKIELLNYKLGQMEVKLKHSMPLLEYRQNSLGLDQKVQEQQELIQTLSRRQSHLVLIKNLYLVLLALLILAGSFAWFWPR